MNPLIYKGWDSKMKTSIVSFRIEEDRLLYIDELITKYSRITGIKTRSQFITHALEFFLTNADFDDSRLKTMGKIYQAREEAAFWSATQKQLADLIDEKTKSRIKKAKEILQMAKDSLESDTYDEDIEAWQEILANTTKDF